MASGDGGRNKSRPERWRKSVEASNLGGTTKQILQQLGRYMDNETGLCFPSHADIGFKASRDVKTVRKHLKIALMAGWIEIIPAKAGDENTRGRGWRRHHYAARWPVDFEGDAMRKKRPSRAVRGEGIPPCEVGECGPAYKNSSYNSSLGSACAHAAVPIDRKRINDAFLDWYPTWPNSNRRSDDKAKKAWFALMPEQRDACIALTPKYLALVADKSRVCSPAEFIRRRLWEGVAEVELSPRQPERVKAAYCGKLWNAYRLWLLLQPAKDGPPLPLAQQRMIDSGLLSADVVARDRRMKFGWPAVNDMMAIARDRNREFHCSTALMPVAADFRQCEPVSPIFAAWRRLHERRGWPFIERPARHVYFPPVADLAADDLDLQVEAAMAAFETRAKEIMDGVQGAKET